MKQQYWIFIILLVLIPCSAFAIDNYASIQMTPSQVTNPLSISANNGTQYFAVYPNGTVSLIKSHTICFDNSCKTNIRSDGTNFAFSPQILWSQLSKSGSTLNDVGSPTSAYNFNNQQLNNIGNLTMSKTGFPNTEIDAGSGNMFGSYVIFPFGSNYFEENGTTKRIEYSNSDAVNVISNAENKLSGKGLILLKNGIYTLTSTITINKPDIKLQGESWLTILQPQINVDGITISNSRDQVTNLFINQTTSGTGNGIKVNVDANSTLISNNRITNAYHAIFFQGGDQNYITISNNQIENSGRADGAIQVSNGIARSTNFVVIKDNTIDHAQSHAIEVLASLGQYVNVVRILDNIVNTPSLAGIFVSQVNDSLIQGNYVSSAKAESLDAEGSSNVIFDTNHVVNGSLQGVITLPIGNIPNTKITVTNNIIDTNNGSTPQGIYIDTGKGVVVSNNQVYVVKDGIEIVHNSTNVSINTNTVNSTSKVGYGIRIDLGLHNTLNKLQINNNIVNNFDNDIGVISGTITDASIKGNNISTFNTNALTLTGSTIFNKIIQSNSGYSDSNDVVIRNQTSSALFQTSQLQVTDALQNGRNYRFIGGTLSGGIGVADFSLPSTSTGTSDTFIMSALSELMKNKNIDTTNHYVDVTDITKKLNFAGQSSFATSHTNTATWLNANGTVNYTLSQNFTSDVNAISGIPIPNHTCDWYFATGNSTFRLICNFNNIVHVLGKQ